MGGFFSRHASPRQITAVGLVVGVTFGIQTRGSWTEDRELMRFGVYAMVAGGLLLFGLLAATPVRWLPGMWQEDGPSFLDRTWGLVAYLGGIASGVFCLWLSPWPGMATAAALVSFTAVAVGFTFVSARRSPG
jgi:hypothetical protein